MRLLSDTIDGDRYPLSLRVLTLKAILGKLRPEPVRVHCRRQRCTHRTGRAFLDRYRSCLHE